MNARRLRRAGALAAVTALGATGLVASGAIADTNDSADKAGKGTATIEMVVDGKEILFEGPRSVDAGAKLEIVNETSLEEVGPHTFSLVEKRLLPESKSDGKQCEQLEGICGKVAKAHKIDLKTFKVGKPDVEAGKRGWDASFGKKGDTWYTETEGETTERKVSAKPGSKLYYLCVVHPFMQGKLNVK